MVNRVKVYVLVIIGIVLFIEGCGSGGVSSTSKATKEIAKLNDEVDYEKLFSVKDKNSSDYLLNLQQMGRVKFLFGNHKESSEYFNKAIDEYNLLFDKGLITSLYNFDRELLATFTNESVLSYLGSDFEWAYAHLYNAMNYLALNDLPQAMIEVRAANNVHKLAVSKRQKIVDNAFAKAAKDSGVGENFTPSGEMKDLFAEANKTIKSKPSRFLNPYIYYVSGIIRELSGRPQDALVDYKQALNYSSNPFVMVDTLRLSARYDPSNYRNLMKKLSATQQKAISDHIKNYNNSNTVILINEVSTLPMLDQLKMGFTLADNLTILMALPIYKSTPNIPNALYPKQKFLQLYVNGTKQLFDAKQYLIANNFNMATYNTQEKYPIYLRILLSKIALQGGVSAAFNNSNVNLMMSLYSAVSVNADRRSFNLLPLSTYISKISIPNSKEYKNKLIVVYMSSQKGKDSQIRVLYSGNK